ncbi:MAG: TIR domain-containing protein [Gammaproteobacteria bacterium]|nr:TIR domain-containing protein [Gammaproteobacteria bacterium]
MADIFLSYASADRDRLQPLVEAMEAEGWSVWWDQHIEAGPAFRGAIEKAMATCRCMVVAWSQASVKSDFVIDEATEGRSRNIMVPLQLDDAQIPLGFRAAQTAQLHSWPDQRGDIDRLISGIRATLDGVAAPERTAPPPETKANTRGWMLTAAALVLAAGAFYFWPQTPTVDAASVAVLPLKNVSGDSSQSYLVDGMHDALISNLSKISSLKVTSATSVRRVDKNLTTPQIASILGVANILEGSVIREGDQVRVIVQLVDAIADEQRWSETYNRQVTTMLALQGEITRAIAEAIKVRLTPQDELSIEAAVDMKPETHDAYLRGMYELHKETLRGYRNGIRILKGALENDPESALAHAGIAYGYTMLGHSYYPDTAYPKAREAAQKALALDDSLPEVHLAMGMYKLYFDWDFEEAETFLRQALELNPSLVSAHYHYAWLLELLGDQKAALHHGELTRSLNPLSPFYNGHLADQYRGAGQFELAIEQATHVIELSETYPLGWYALGNTYAEMGRFEEAIEAHEHLRNSYFWSWALGYSYAKAGRLDDARAVGEAIEQVPDNAIPLALLAAATGDEEAMYRWLEAARDGKMPFYPWLVSWFPPTAAYRDQPRMRALAAELGL